MKLIVNNPDIPFTNFDYHGDKNNPRRDPFTICDFLRFAMIYRVYGGNQVDINPKSRKV